MGKRKERRLAALSAAGRRVKLDLSVEPSGDLVGTSFHEDGSVLDQIQHVAVPISPTSSGKHAENPLSLLEQYSDEEDVASLNSEEVSEGTPWTIHDVDAVHPTASEGELNTGKFNDVVEAQDVVDVRSDINLNASMATENDDDITGGNAHVEHLVVQGCSLEASAEWKMVLHEESNQYYYWNTVTGETSWEIPEVFVHDENQPKSDAILDAGEDFSVTEAIQNRKKCSDEDNREKSNHSCETNNVEGFNLIQSDNGNPFYGGDFVITHQDQVVHSGEQVSEVCFQLTSEANGVYPNLSNKSSEGRMVSSADLVKYGESLLKRINALQENSSDWSSKYTLEIKLRISDCKELSSSELSLLPLWHHIEKGLKKIDLFVGVQEKLKCEQEANSNCKIDHLEHIKESREDNTCKVNDVSLQNAESETSTFADGLDKTGISWTAVNTFSENTEEAEIMEEGEIHPSPVNTHTEKLDCVVQETNEISISMEKAETNAIEDADMDVDMEVDDVAIHYDDVAIHYDEKLKQFQHVPTTEKYPDHIPLPPTEEWIPPPPDNEPIPPPPDELSTPSYPVSLYTEPYALSYSVPTYDYYVPVVSEVVNTNYYTFADGTQIVQPHLPSFYEPVANQFVESAPGVVNPVDATTYYDTGNSTTESSIYHDSIFSNPTVSIGFEYNSVSNLNVGCNFPSVGTEVVHDPLVSVVATSTEAVSVPMSVPLKGNLEMPSYVRPVSSDIQAAGVVLGKESNSISLSTSTKHNEKGRSKKRPIGVVATLRSNKKVSSLVDKWKAAKEELHGEEEEEPENAYEILEKKRQKEIEEWHAQQIASGEARANANFLPLGRDWRERVKRKRAISEAAETKANVTSSSETSKIPDLDEWSKDLPSGWQAYWDEASKDVYYANRITSQTTWTRPSQ